MGRISRLRQTRRMIRQGAPMRVVPSRRGLATVFTLCALAGVGAGLGGLAISRVVARHRAAAAAIEAR